MISTWMLYAAGVSLLLGSAALALERVSLGRGRPVRWIWVAALAGSTLVPVCAMGASVVRGAWVPEGIVIPLNVTPAAARVPPAEITPEQPAREGRPWAERALGILWIGSSLALLAGILVSLVVLERRQQHWRYHRVGGRMVLVSESTGPATIGFLWPKIVVPRWVLNWDEAAQRRLVAHEQEHEHAGDPWLLLGATTALVLLPWNLVLWWQVRRLRLAVEVDCDARVLQALPGARAYGLLLLDAGRRASRTRLPTAAFSEPCSLLERRIRILTHSLPRLRRPALLALSGVAAVAAVSVAALPVPERPSLKRIFQPMPGEVPVTAPALGFPTELASAAPQPGTAGYAPLAPIRLQAAGNAPKAHHGATLALWTTAQPRIASPVTTPFDVAPRLRNYPDLIRLAEREHFTGPRGVEVGGTVLLLAHLDATGRVVETRTLRGSGNEELDRVAREVLQRADFAPALWHAQPTDVWVQVPITFQTRGTREPNFR